MKLETFTLGIRILKCIKNNPNCTIPQIKDNFGIQSISPPCSEEKNLYKVISFLSNQGFIDKIDNPSISHRGAHYFLKITQEGSQLLSEIKGDLIPERYNLRVKDSIRQEEISSISIEFSRHSYEILNNLLQGLLYELPKDSRLFLSANRAKIKNLIEKSHAQLQEKFSKLLDSKK